MFALSLSKTMRSTNKEIAVVLSATAFIIFLPVIAVVSVTNVGALSDSSNKLYTGTASTTNTYIYGYCTFWAAQRREEIGKPIPNNWGDAHTWDDSSRTAGYTVDHTPAPYAIMQTDSGELGHVAFVEKVEADGTWTISEMNAKGWDIVSGRTFSAADAKNYNFIH